MRSPHKLLPFGRGRGLHPLEQALGIRLDDDMVAVFLGEESFPDRMIEKSGQFIEVSRDVEDPRELDC
jgi:hypothetical protein